MDREIIDPLLGLLDQRIAEQFPGQLLGLAADFFERLIDRHGADRHRRIAYDPFADRVDVAPGRQVHDRVGAPARCPHHLLDLLGDTRGDDRIADVGVDLHQEIAADDHRLGFRLVDVVRDDRAAAGDLVADEIRRPLLPDAGPEGLAGIDARGQCLAAELVPDRDSVRRGRDGAGRYITGRDIRLRGIGFARGRQGGGIGHRGLRCEDPDLAMWGWYSPGNSLDGRSYPYAGTTRIRFKGFARNSASQPLPGAPL